MPLYSWVRKLSILIEHGTDECLRFTMQLAASVVSLLSSVDVSCTDAIPPPHPQTIFRPCFCVKGKTEGELQCCWMRRWAVRKILTKWFLELRVLWVFFGVWPVVQMTLAAEIWDCERCVVAVNLTHSLANCEQLGCATCWCCLLAFLWCFVLWVSIKLV